MSAYCGDIGEGQKEYEVEPLNVPAVPEPAPLPTPQPVEPEKEPTHV